MRVVITGASGFIAKSLVQALKKQGHSVVGIDRCPPPDKNVFTEFQEADLETYQDWPTLMRGSDAVIHLAAITSSKDSKSDDVEEECMRVNSDLTVQLAKAALGAGIARFVFLSSVKAVCEYSPSDTAIDEDTPPRPQDAYGRSKLQAERLLVDLLKRSKTQLVILRPCVVYGPEVKGPILSMLKLVEKQIPLPFGFSRARRSLISIDNLCDAISRVLSTDTPSGTFFVSDDEPVELKEILRLFAEGLHKRSILLPVPRRIVKALLTLAGKSELYQKTFENLMVDNTLFKSSFSWEPRESFETASKKMTDWYLGHKSD